MVESLVDEKGAVSTREQWPHHDSIRRERTLSSRPSWKPLLAAFLIAGLVVYARDTYYPGDVPLPSPESNAKHFQWRDLEAKPYLDYVPCMDNEHQCARLELPMDYWNGTTDAKIGLAVIRKPAVVPITHPQYGGAILLNPGGPGGSGVGFLLRAGDFIRNSLEGYEDDEKYFDMISFDPRGVSDSKPNVQCTTDRVFDQSLDLRIAEEGTFSSSDAVFGRMWSLVKAKSGLCSLPTKEPDVKKYVSTASVARDMLELVERHGEWREKEANRLLESVQPCRGRTSLSTAGEHAATLERVKHRKDAEKINYIGYSYGTLLGNTFAAIYPNRINRLVVDGVVDAYDYTKSLWLDNVVDAEKDMDLFYYHCARVGYPRCALANQTSETTLEGVRTRTLGIIESLYHDPLVVLEPVPEVIMYSDVKALVAGALYSPIGSFPLMADLLYALEQGDGTFLAPLQPHKFNCFACSGIAYEDLGVTPDATMAISCGDGDDQTNVTKAEFRYHLSNLTEISPTIGEWWAEHRLTCIHYSVRPLHRFHGPWEGNTSFPILEVGNTADPVTPGRYAKKMAKGFKGAVALIQDSGGHCSLAAPSACTEEYIRKYFQKGEMPPVDTICPADVLPFGPTDEKEEILDVNAEARRLRSDGLAKALYLSGGGLARRRRTAEKALLGSRNKVESQCNCAAILSLKGLNTR